MIAGNVDIWLHMFPSFFVSVIFIGFRPHNYESQLAGLCLTNATAKTLIVLGRLPWSSQTIQWPGTHQLCARQFLQTKCCITTPPSCKQKCAHYLNAYGIKIDVQPQECSMCHEIQYFGTWFLPKPYMLRTCMYLKANRPVEQAVNLMYGRVSKIKRKYAPNLIDNISAAKEGWAARAKSSKAPSVSLRITIVGMMLILFRNLKSPTIHPNYTSAILHVPPEWFSYQLYCTAIMHVYSITTT